MTVDDTVAVDEAATAQGLARRLHEGQVDKLGEPYIDHVARVARRVTSGGHGPQVQAAAWLHDVVEDCGVSLEDLAARGIAADVVTAVAALTHVEGEPYPDAVRRAAADPIARVVKLADNADNSDPARLARLDAATRARLERKYAEARQILQGEEQGPSQSTV